MSLRTRDFESRASASSTTPAPEDAARYGALGKARKILYTLRICEIQSILSP